MGMGMDMGMRRFGGSKRETANPLDVLATATVWIDTDPTTPWASGDYTIYDGTPDTITTIANKGTLGGTITQATQSRQPSAEVTRNDSGTARRVAAFLSTDRMASSAAASSFKSWHDGSGLDLFVVFGMADATPAANATIFATNVIGLADVGIHAYVATTGRPAVRVSNAIGTAYANAAFDAALTDGEIYLLRVTFDSSLEPPLRCTLIGGDGSFNVASSAATGSPSAADPTYTLQIGATGNNANPIVADVAFLAAFSDALANAAADSVGDYIGTRWLGV